MAKDQDKVVHKVWDEFDSFPVIGSLKQAVEERWHIKINFTDASGYLRGVEAGKFFSPANPICEAIVRSESGFQERKQTALKVTAGLAASHSQPRLERCSTGVSVLAVPVVIEGKFVGCAYADGFLLADSAAEQRQQVKNFLQRFVKDDSLNVEDLVELADQDVAFLGAIIQAIVDHLAFSQTSIEVSQEKIGRLSSEILGSTHAFKEMIGESSRMKEIYLLLEKAKDSNATILINGENGTGKELIARSLHFESQRAKDPFMAINCGAFNENLLESELFGHVKGAFTGANSNKKGLFEEAKNGTIFLDEIGETPPSMQVKLLRVLQEGTFMPVGGTKEGKTNARVICATNRDLQKMIKKGDFREDLYYRLDVINVVLPALRERRDDIPLLCAHFLKKYAGGKKHISERLMNAFQTYSWPGNIRQLENEIQRMCVLVSGDVLENDDLNDRILDEVRTSGRNYQVKGKLKESVEQYEREQIIDGLKRNEGNKSALAREMGISRTALTQKMKKYKVTG